MAISRAIAIQRFFNDPANGSSKPKMGELKELRSDKKAYDELAEMCAAELGETLEEAKNPNKTKVGTLK
jgi:hypothetical protein